MKIKIKKFFENYLATLVKSIKISDLQSIEKASFKILETVKKKEQYLFVEMVVQLQSQIIIFVII